MYIIFGVIFVLAVAIIIASFAVIKYGKYVIGNPIQVGVDKSDLQYCTCYDSMWNEYEIIGSDSEIINPKSLAAVVNPPNLN